jgi:hypothetical protein
MTITVNFAIISARACSEIGHNYEWSGEGELSPWLSLQMNGTNYLGLDLINNLAADIIIYIAS